MKILLLQPPVRDFYETDIRLQPIGLAYLKAAVKKYLPDVNVILKDYHAGWGRRTIPYPDEFSHLRAFYGNGDKSPFSTFHHYYHFGADFETIAKEVAKEKPGLVGISSLFSPYYREVIETAEAIKRAWQVPILIGGSHVSGMPEAMLGHPAVDFVIRGEGEKPFVKFLRSWQGKKNFWKIQNLGFKKDGKIILNPCEDNYPVNELPVPDLSGLSKTNYLYEGKPICFILTSRGCPCRCSFCSVRMTFGTHYRRRANEDILIELKTRYRQGYRIFDFEDDNLTFDKRSAGELLSRLPQIFPKKNVRFTAMNGICYWNLDRDLLRLMREAGFTHLNLSLVSSDPAVLKKMSRPLDLKKYKTVVSSAFNQGFKITAYQILGLPGESTVSMIQTLEMNAKLPVLIGISPFYLTPGSPIAKDFTAEAPDPFTARLTALGNASGSARLDIYTLFVSARILNFLKGIPLSGDSPLEKALAIAQKRDKRSAIGVAILKKMLAGGGFHFATSEGLKPQLLFQLKIFFKLWHNLDRIITQEGKIIRIHRV